jgi:hypothetical protein
MANYATHTAIDVYVRGSSRWEKSSWGLRNWEKRLTIAILVLEGSLAWRNEVLKSQEQATYEEGESLLELGHLLLSERISLERVSLS